MTGRYESDADAFGISSAIRDEVRRRADFWPRCRFADLIADLYGAAFAGGSAEFAIDDHPSGSAFLIRQSCATLRSRRRQRKAPMHRPSAFIGEVELVRGQLTELIRGAITDLRQAGLDAAASERFHPLFR